MSRDDSFVSERVEALASSYSVNSHLNPKTHLVTRTEAQRRHECLQKIPSKTCEILIHKLIHLDGFLSRRACNEHLGPMLG
jgi:hypothetical protein